MLFGGKKKLAEEAAARGWRAGESGDDVFDRAWLIFRYFGPAGSSFRNVLINPAPAEGKALGVATFQGQTGSGAELLEVDAAPLRRPIAAAMLLATSNARRRWEGGRRRFEPRPIRNIAHHSEPAGADS